jgi:multicomponent Na+:H+ antiporter subunit G
MTQQLLEWLTLLCIAVGTGFMLISSVGLMRLPDFYTRLHAAGLSRTLGLGAILLGVAIFAGSLTILARLAIILGFFLFTTPISAHVLGRAVYFAGLLDEQTLSVDELADAYDPDTHEVR